MKGREDIELLLSASETLLQRVHEANSGFPDGSKCKMFVDTYHEAVHRLVRKFPEHPRTINLEKVDRLASEVLWREARSMVKETEPLYSLLQDSALFQERTVQFLLHVDQAVLHHVDQVNPLSLECTPDLLRSYMQLFCNAVKLQLLARHMPSCLFIQMHTLLLNLSQVQNGEPVTDPAGRVQLIAYVQAYSDPVPKLQSDFQCISKRIGQVLESSVFPVLLAFGSRSAIQESKLLNMDTAGRPTEEKLADRQAGWRALQCLQRMRDWIFYAIAACPGECVCPGAMAAIQGMLEDTMRVRIYREHCEWVHPIFQSHVRPVMLLAKPVMSADRKAHKKMAKSLVETCHEKAASTCTQQHQQRRILVAQSLESIAAQFSADPSCLVPQLELILGALAYARDEILWYFLHVNEVPPMRSFKAFLGPHQPLKEGKPDATVPSLLAAMQKAVQMVSQFSSTVQESIIADIRGSVKAVLLPGVECLQAVERRAPNAEMVQLIGSFTELVNVVMSVELRSSDQDTEKKLAKARDTWERVALRLVSGSHMVTAADLEEATGNKGFLSTFAAIMHKTRYMCRLQVHMKEFTSLADLHLCLPKLQASTRAAAASGLPHLAGITGWLFAFSQLGPKESSPPQPQRTGEGQSEALARFETSRPPALTAESLTKEWVQLVTDRMTGLLTRVHNEGMLVHEQPLLLEEVLKGRKTVTAERVGFFREQTSAASASNPQTPSRMGSGQSTTSHQPKFHAEWQELVALGRALGDGGAVTVTERVTVCPPQLLLDAVQKTISSLLRELPFSENVSRLPRELERNCQGLWFLLHRFSCACGTDFTQITRQAILSQMEDKQLVAAGVAGWLLQEFMAPKQTSAANIAPAKHGLVSNLGKAMSGSQYASREGMTYLLRCFGYSLAEQLAHQTESLLQGALSALQAILCTHAAALQDLHDRFKERSWNGCWDACQKAAAKFGNFAAVLEHLSAVGKVLSFRLMLAQAVNRSFQQQLPALHANIKAASAGANQAGHAGVFLDLPEPQEHTSHQQGADPQMVAFMQAGGPDALQMWQLWPVLLGLTLRAEPRTVDACTSVVNEGLVNISVCASSFASAVFQACEALELQCENCTMALATFARCGSYGLVANLDVAGKKAFREPAQQQFIAA